jgi:drug/metabolite transporter (DMT)-like permease
LRLGQSPTILSDPTPRIWNDDLREFRIERRMAGAMFAVAACALWALSFVSPVILGQFSPYAVTLGRYGAFGLASLALVPFAMRQLRALSGADWAKAAWLSIVGHMAYYLLLATAIQLSDVPGPTVVLGLLPLTIPIYANLRKQELPWRTLSAPLLGIAAGLFLVNGYEYRRIQSDEGVLRYAAGIGFAFASLACWTWYGVSNAAWLRARPHITAAAWTMAQGITLFPLVVFAALVLAAPEAGHALGDPSFVTVSLVVGLGSTWLATLCWNQASRLLPTTLAGQLIVFVTIAAVIYGSVYRGMLPSIAVISGVSLLAAAVALGVRAIQRRLTAEATASRICR